MKFGKRDFLKLSGLSLLGISVKPSPRAFAGSGSAPRIESNVKPGPNALTAHRWAMVVDMRACKADEGCEECMKVCHAVHNVPDFRDPNKPDEADIKNEIKWIWTEEFEHAFPEKEHEHIKNGVRGNPFVVLCNHCDNPPCVRVCPTKATWKREDGIVMMDMHRCIGCRFCMAACPYGSRSFNWKDPRKGLESPPNPKYPTRTRGVVEKCNFCAERLAEGQIPACVEKCKEIGVNALHFGDLEDPDSEVRKLLENNFTIRRKPEIGTSPEIYYIV